MEHKLYEEGKYDVWLKNSNEKEKFLEVLEESFFKEFKCENKISILDLGCGDGFTSRIFLDFLERRNVDFKYLGVEPASGMIEKAKKNLKIFGDKVELKKGSFTDYENSDEKYNFILLSHSLYFYQNKFNKILSNLKEKGNLIIIHQGKNGINQFHRKFPEISNSKLPNNYTTYFDIILALEESNLDFNFLKKESFIDISKCKQNLNLENDLINFIFEKKLSLEEQEKVQSYIQTLDEKIIHDIGVIFVK